jgi:hypothetical protein
LLIPYLLWLKRLSEPERATPETKAIAFWQRLWFSGAHPTLPKNDPGRKRPYGPRNSDQASPAESSTARKVTIKSRSRVLQTRLFGNEATGFGF